MPAEPTRVEVDNMVGEVVLEFGASWCLICQAARPLIERALAEHASVRHVRIEDGKGEPLGRSFHIKLWPTLVFLRDGTEVARVVRPTAESDLRSAWQRLGASG